MPTTFWSKTKENQIFQEARNGYGFTETPQKPDGLYCTGCMTTHKRPTKMYTNNQDTLCKHQVAKLYNPTE